MIEKLLSKSKENGGLTLINHSTQCADNCYKLSKEVGCKENIAQLSYISGLLHDIGKITNLYQRFLQGNVTNKEIEYLHNEISAYIISQYIVINQVDTYGNDDFCKTTLIRCALYHHQKSKSIDSTDKFNFGSINLKTSKKEEETIKEFLTFVLNSYNNKFGGNCLYKISIADKPSNKEYSTLCFSNMVTIRDVRRESDYMIILHVLRFSDAISCGDAIKVDLDSYLYNSVCGDIEFKKPKGYDERFYEQLDKAEKLSNKDFSILESPTGFGKTMLGLMYLLSNNRKGFWVCPRNSIAESIYRVLSNEVVSLGLENKVKIGLLLTNEYVYGDANADIIVTNLDNYVRPILKDDASRVTMSMVSNNVIFDEYHEYIDDCLSGMFAMVVAMRSKLVGVKTLLMSATIPPFAKDRFPYKYCKLDDNYCLITMRDIVNKKITDKEYSVYFADNIESDVRNTNTLVSLNSVSSTQNYYRNGFADRIIHSRYSEEDLSTIKEMLYLEHGKKTIMDKPRTTVESAWVATNIISTGTDVSFENLVYNNVQPDRLIQLIGRVNRFSECEETPKIILAYTDFNKKSEIGGLQTNYSYDLSQKFFNFLTENIKNGDIVSLDYLYGLRDKFYVMYDNEINAYYDKIIKRGFEHLSELNYLWCKPNLNVEHKKYVCNRKSLRNNGCNYSFWGIFKDEDNNKMSEPIEVDTMLISNEILDSKAVLDAAVKYIKNNDLIEQYFNNKYAFKNSAPIMREVLISKAVQKDKAFPILDNFKYSSEIGIYKTQQETANLKKNKNFVENLAV